MTFRALLTGHNRLIDCRISGGRGGGATAKRSNGRLAHSARDTGSRWLCAELRKGVYHDPRSKILTDLKSNSTLFQYISFL